MEGLNRVYFVTTLDPMMIIGYKVMGNRWMKGLAYIPLGPD